MPCGSAPPPMQARNTLSVTYGRLPRRVENKGPKSNLLPNPRSPHGIPRTGRPLALGRAVLPAGPLRSLKTEFCLPAAHRYPKKPFEPKESDPPALHGEQNTPFSKPARGPAADQGAAPHYLRKVLKTRSRSFCFAWHPWHAARIAAGAASTWLSPSAPSNPRLPIAEYAWRSFAHDGDARDALALEAVPSLLIHLQALVHNHRAIGKFAGREAFQRLRIGIVMVEAGVGAFLGDEICESRPRSDSRSEMERSGRESAHKAKAHTNVEPQSRC